MESGGCQSKGNIANCEVQEGNPYPEISRTERRKFKERGNAWLERRHSKIIDWKLDRHDLDVPSPVVRAKDVVLPQGRQLVADGIKENKQQQPKAGGVRTQIILAPLPPKKPEEKFAELSDLHQSSSELKAHSKLPRDPVKSRGGAGASGEAKEDVVETPEDIPEPSTSSTVWIPTHSLMKSRCN